jgi:N-acetylmuramoyl-L-alanine amidase
MPTCRRLCLLLLLIVPLLSRAQESVPVIFNQAPARNTRIAAITTGQTLYCSVGDLARAFELRSIFNAETGRLELSAKQFTIVLTPDNPFITILDEKRNANLLQLQTNVLQPAGAFYVPIAEFIPVFDDIMRENVTFNPSRREIDVGRLVRISPFDISSVSFEQKSNGDLIRLQCSKRLPNAETWCKPIGSDTWVYVTLADGRADVASIEGFRPNGILKKVLVFQSPTSVQLTFKLKGEIKSAELIPAEGSDDLLIALHRPTEEEISARKTRDVGGNLQRERNRWKLDVLVIDAGHGGEDPGALGVSRVKEKDITLAVALKLGRLIERNLRDVRVVYTRTTDHFVELDRRGQIANQAGGKLFISIHCNSMARKPGPTNGFEIYLLRPGKTENALRIAERENAVVKYEQGYEQRYQKLTEENFILLTMAQSAYVKYSEQFADILHHEMGKGTGLDNNGVKQAGFYVLVGASMPNVLVETAYLSNRHDEKILNSDKGQQRIAESIFNAVKRYKREYEKSLEEGKDPGADPQ